MIDGEQIQPDAKNQESFQLYGSFGKNLYRIPVGGSLSSLPLATGTLPPNNIGSGVITGTLDMQQNVILGGKDQFDNTQAGFILGSDKGTYKFYIGNTTNSFSWDGTEINILGSIVIFGGVFTNLYQAGGTNFRIFPGDGVNGGKGSALFLFGGSVDGTNSAQPGDIQIEGGGGLSDVLSTGHRGGSVLILGGPAYGTASQIGGTVEITGGLGINGGASGDVIISSGSQGGIYIFGGGGTGGNVVLGNPGDVQIQKIGTALQAHFDASLIATSDKTFTFPNYTGTFLTTGMDTMTYSGTISLDITLARVHKTTTINATGNSTINASGAGTNGDLMQIIITNDATSGKTITFGTNFKPNGTLVGTASKTAVVSFVSDGSNWYECARVTGL